MSYPAPEVVRFFDRLAPEYERRLSSNRSPYHRYFHCRRLEAALSGMSLEGKTILDIGAGTGLLYERLRQRVRSFEYLACDCSPEMLARSSIPRGCRVLGSVQDLPAGAGPFDCAFVLGVSTYNSREAFRALLKETARRLRPGGQVVVTFTHRRSLDQWLRRLARPVAKRLPGSSRLLMGQSFPLQAYTPTEAAALAAPVLQPHTLRWLNQTLSPFNRWFPRCSVGLAHLLERHLQSHPCLLGWLSADFLLVFEKG